MEGEFEVRQAYNAILANDFEQAIECFKRAIALEPNNASYHYRLSITCARSNRLSEAIEHARLAFELEPWEEVHKLHLHHLQAQKLLEQAENCFGEDPKRFDAAVRLLDEATALDPLSVAAYLMLALASMGLGNGEQALQAVKEALRLDPQNEHGKRLLKEIQANELYTNTNE